MRRSLIGCLLLMAVLLPNIGAAQGVYVVPNQYPQVTAANAFWQLRGDPVFHAGTFYYPAGPSVYFDGNVMMRTDTFQGVPIYEDATQLPFTVLYIPIGGNVVRPYERRRKWQEAQEVGRRRSRFKWRARRLSTSLRKGSPGSSRRRRTSFIRWSSRRRLGRSAR